MQPCIQTLFADSSSAGSLPPAHPIRYVVVIAAKLALATAIIVYLAHTERMGLTRLWTVLQHPGNVIVLVAAMLLLVLVLAARWRVLLYSQGYYCSFRSVLALTFVAVFFDSLLPGGTSDIVRGYLFDRNFLPQDRVRAASTVLVDRFLGIMTLLLIALGALTLQVHGDEREPWPALRATVAIAGVVFLLGFLLLCSKGTGGRGRFAHLLARSRYGALCLDIFDAIRSYRHRQTALLHAILLSVLGHVLVIGCFCLLGLWLGETQLSLTDYLFVVPVGLVVAQMPVSPGGIGVGHVGFYSLFALAGSRLGADIFSLYVVLHFVSSLPGLACFFAMRRRAGPSPSQTAAAVRPTAAGA